MERNGATARRPSDGAGGGPRRAITLTELLVVIGIMVLVTTIVVAAIAPFMRGRSLGAATRLAQAMIYQARTYAATHRCPATLYFDSRGRSITLFNSPLGVPTVRDNQVGKPQFLPRGAAFLVDGGDPLRVVRRAGGSDAQPYLVFSPSGSLDPSPTGMGGVGNWEVYIGRESGTAHEVKVIEIIFASGLVKTREESQ